ncbi:MAG: hypothetical protein N2167_00230 [Flavobacteriales bacterium]|nr:hypothetical protein [Flavobacteriales bacterium]
MNPVLSVLAIFVASSLLFIRCGQYPANIPYVPIDITISTFDPQFVSLQAVGGWAYLNGGSRGLILYRASIDQVNCYERHCPYDTENPCGKVSVDSNGLFLVDNDCYGEGCGSRFSLINGSVVDGVAIYPLKQYNTSFDGVLIRVFN